MRITLLGVVLVAASATLALADDVTVYEEDGVTYRETRRTIRRPVSETRYEERERTVYRRECRTECRELQRDVLVPVTEYRWEAYWAGRWNPFAYPYLAQRLVPRTHWERRTEVVQVPLTHTELVPETRTERVPIVTRRMVDEEVVRRVAISPPSRTEAAPTSRLAERKRIGGVARMESDPPRQAADAGWRSAGEVRRR